MTKDQLQAEANKPWRSMASVGEDYGIARQRVHQLVNRWGITWPPMPVVVKPHPRGSRGRYKIEMNLCRWGGCYEPKAPDRQMCPVHLASENKRFREFYARKRSQR